ncbi:MAG: TonB family protein [Bacteroidota bacterium]
MILTPKGKQEKKRLLALFSTLLLVGFLTLTFSYAREKKKFKIKETTEDIDSSKVRNSNDPSYDKTFTKVPSPAAFPGGTDGWKKYLEANLKYPPGALSKKTEGDVTLQIIVEKDGSVSEVRALNDPGNGLLQEAIRLIKEGPKWEPANIYGRVVRYRFQHVVAFKLGS